MGQNNAIKLRSGGVISADYLSHAKNSFLEALQVEDFIAACGRPLRPCIRINRLKISPVQFDKIAADNGWVISPVPWCEDGFWISGYDDVKDFSLGNTPEHIQGLFYIQEASSMLPPMALWGEGDRDLQPLVIDMAAAPGSKTTQLAAMMNNQGVILANELSASRLKSLHHNLVRCGVMNTCLSHLDARKIGGYMPEQFDFVLLDAPCSGEGTVRKDPNALSDWKLSKVEALASLQQELIMSAYKALKPGGRLVYSTCTLSLQEDHDVARYLSANTDAQTIRLDRLFAGAERAVTAEGYLHMLPQIFDSEGFFVACFEKPAREGLERELAGRYDSPFRKADKKLTSRLKEYLASHFGIQQLPSNYKLLQRDRAIWLFPQAIEAINRFLKVNRAGLELAQIFPNKIRSSHEMACCLGGLATRQIIGLSDRELEQFYAGQNLSIEAGSKRVSHTKAGEVLLSYKSAIVGLAEYQKNTLKNRLPRELVKDNYRVVRKSTTKVNHGSQSDNE